MEMYQQRVVEEREQLADRLSRLRPFFKTETFGQLSTEDQMLLSVQCGLMESLHIVLSHRIARFDGEKVEPAWKTYRDGGETYPGDQIRGG